MKNENLKYDSLALKRLKSLTCKGWLRWNFGPFLNLNRIWVCIETKNTFISNQWLHPQSQYLVRSGFMISTKIVLRKSQRNWSYCNELLDDIIIRNMFVWYFVHILTNLEEIFLKKNLFYTTHTQSQESVGGWLNIYRWNGVWRYRGEWIKKAIGALDKWLWWCSRCCCACEVDGIGEHVTLFIGLWLLL